MRLAAAILAAALALAAITPARADERIGDYASDITVEPDGTLDVVETIAVDAEGERITHGIYRDFPTIYGNGWGPRTRVKFDVSAVTRDGSPEPYATESISNGVRIRIGSAGTIIPHGMHVYKIRYATNRQIGFFRDYDEIYWNVTGNGWGFPIDRASATVRLPEGAHIKQFAFYTGRQGATDKNATATRLSDAAIRFDTTAPLYPEEGLTVAVGFNKGVVRQPTAAQNFDAFIKDNMATVAAIAGALVLLSFYLFAWLRVGQDPARGTIVPLFAPPKGFSPAAVRFVHRMDYDRKCFAAALISMAVKGYITIAQDEDGTYTLTRTGRSEAECGLSNGEQALAHEMLFGPRGTIELKSYNHVFVAKAIAVLQKSLRDEDEKVYFVTNQPWFYAGLFVLAITGVATALLSEDAGASGFLMIWLSVWTVATSFLLHRAATAWADVINGPGSRIVNVFSAAFSTAFATPFFAAWVFAMFAFSRMVSLWAILALAVGGVIAYVFYHLLKAPTLLGAKIRDQIDGFRMFLTTTEKRRLETLHPPDVTPDVFEKFLPYAIALDAENEWSRKFAAQAEAAGRAPDSNYSPRWYSGSSYSNFTVSNFASSIGSSMASAAASASTAPGSSSGSGGGGSSGGGGGGGGGGGW